MSDHLLMAVIGYCVIREIIFLMTVHRLVNKIMSANFYDYQLSKGAGKQKEAAPLVEDQVHQEDLGYLDEILS